MAGQELNFDENSFDLHDLRSKIPPIPVHDEYLNPNFANVIYQNHQDITYKRYIGSGVSFVSLVAENLLSHPFLVLRRQCQVHHASNRYHILPFTLLPTICHLHQRQGLTTLWKGLGSVLLVRGMSLGVEDLISKVTPWPKEVSWHSTVKQFFQHTLLKCVSLAVVTPFYSASFVETVQSEIASERPGILDVFREGFMRLLNWSGHTKGRMLPIWAIIVPTVTLGLARYLLTIMIRSITYKILKIQFRNRFEANGALPKGLSSNSVLMHEVNLTASLIATITSDVILYPCETVVHRLHLQGTRTIVDNLDNGRSVLPILTNYAGAIDCYENCLATEGVFGLYKGFGALIMQYSVHIALLRMSHFILSEISDILKKPKPKVQQSQTQIDISPPAISNLTTTRRSYLLP